jgi:hypothetical protein
MNLFKHYYNWKSTLLSQDHSFSERTLGIAKTYLL